MIRLKKLKAVQVSLPHLSLLLLHLLYHWLLIVEERKNYGKSKAGDANSDEEGDTSGEDESNDDEV